MPNARVIVEYEPQSRVEGEIQQMEASFPVTEFAQVVLGHARGRRSASDVTIFDSVGFALEDYSALRFLHALLGEGHVARRQIDLVPVLDDPKDLFGGTLGAGVARPRLVRSA
jgi:ornithine cyclodeaminase